jgi:aquaporin Z
MMPTLKKNWRIYLMEGFCLGLFMTSASVFGTLLEYPNSVIHIFISNEFIRLCVMGIAMGATAIAIIYSPMGKLSGAHMNPAVTFSFLILGKVKPTDAIFYSIFQIAGGVVFVFMMSLLLGDAFTSDPVNHVVTAPGKYGSVNAFVIEVIIAFCMMTMILITSNHHRLAKYTGVIAGFLVMGYVILAGPVSGFSMNPARTIASAIPAGNFRSFWIYMTAPFIGMFSSAVLYKILDGKTLCAKLHHHPFYTCIFNCGYCNHISSLTAASLSSSNEDAKNQS